MHSIASGLYLPPKEWDSLLKAYAILARRYQIIKTAEWGKIDIDTDINSILLEMGLLTSYIGDAIKEHNIDSSKISRWVIDSANELLIATGKEEGIEIVICESCGHAVVKAHHREHFVEHVTR